MKSILKDLLTVIHPGRRQLWKRHLADLNKAFELQKGLLAEYHNLAALETQKCFTDNLRRWDCDAFAAYLAAPESDEVWREAENFLAEIEFPEMSGGVNPGDQRLIFNLINYLKPKRILEIGTHIGSSTVHIAAALKSSKSLEGGHLTTVDIKDVNDEKIEPWKDFGCKYSPKEMLRQLGIQESVTFKTSDSISFLESTTEKFDFIFLDGDHSSTAVYNEIPRALLKLSADGVVLLHDFFPDLVPLWPDSDMTPSMIHHSVLPGPFLAVQRLVREENGFCVIPFGKLPWPTKLGTNVTSLAVMTRPG